MCIRRSDAWRRRRTCGPMFSLAAMTLACVAVAVAAASAPASAGVGTSRQYTMMVEELAGGLDEAGTRPTLVSVSQVMSLTLPARPGAPAAWEGDAEASEIDPEAAESLTFDENFDPIWYYVLRRRGFQHLDWSGCGGKWRPEWSTPRAAPSSQDDGAAISFGRLRHYLAHHAVCTYSSVSFCGASRERDAASQFQWAAQFVSTLTSSPLSWTAATPRHSRPNGIILQEQAQHNTSAHDGSSSSSSSSGGGTGERWCSYHLVYHDTLCTQHVSPFLNGGRSGRGVQEGLPAGIFRAAFPSFVRYFGAPFQHFTVKATQVRRPGGNATADAQPPTVQLRVEVRMSMVTGEVADLAALAAVWTRELPAYARDGSLQIHVGPGGLSGELRAALPTSSIAAHRGGAATAATATALESTPASSQHTGRSPEVQYAVHTHGKDHGYMTVELQPAFALLDVHSGIDAEAHGAADDDASPSTSFVPREGDIVRVLLLFPLHLVRPSLYSMESLLGSTRVVHAHTDVISNTLAVLLETTIAPVHVAAYEAAYTHARHCHAGASRGGATHRCRAHDGVLLGRFRLFFGWSALREMPPDDNSNRLVPQPVVAIHRAAAGPLTDSAFCHTQHRNAAAVSAAAGGGAVRQLDHEDSLESLFKLLNGSVAGGGGGDDACVYWVRSTAASGTTIPGPDGAMLFNVLSLGLVFSAIGAGMLVRLTRRMTCKMEDLPAFLGQDDAASS